MWQERKREWLGCGCRNPNVPNSSPFATLHHQVPIPNHLLLAALCFLGRASNILDSLVINLVGVGFRIEIEQPRFTLDVQRLGVLPDRVPIGLVPLLPRRYAHLLSPVYPIKPNFLVCLHRLGDIVLATLLQAHGHGHSIFHRLTRSLDRCGQEWMRRVSDEYDTCFWRYESGQWITEDEFIVDKLVRWR